MNLSDIKIQGNEVKEKLKEIEDIIEALKESTYIISDWIKNSTDIILKDNIAGGYEPALSNSIKLTSITKNSCEDYINSLRKINFRKSYFIIAELKNKYIYFELDIFIDDFLLCTDLIHELISYTEKEKIPELLLDAYNTIIRIINQYNLVIKNIRQVELIQNSLINNKQDDITLKIRLMNENDNVVTLIENISLINSIYTNINMLIGEEDEKLKFTRAESGTFEIYVTGCVTAILTMKPILEFAYKMYSEQFSKKAKLETEIKALEKRDKQIKVRGEYLKLMKEAEESKEIKKLNEAKSEKVLNILGNLDNDISELFSLNPFIEVDDKELGIKEMKGNVISIKSLRKSDVKIESIDELGIS